MAVVSQTLETVTDYITSARTLLQDLVAPNRYQDTELVLGLDMCLLELSRVRPDVMLASRYEASPNARVQQASDPTQSSAGAQGVSPVLALTPRQIAAPRRHGVLVVPSFSAIPAAQWPISSVPVPPQYRMAVLFYMVSTAQLRDDEVTQDGRATIFRNMFLSQMAVGK